MMDDAYWNLDSHMAELRTAQERTEKALKGKWVKRKIASIIGVPFS